MSSVCLHDPLGLTVYQCCNGFSPDAGLGNSKSAATHEGEWYLAQKIPDTTLDNHAAPAEMWNVVIPLSQPKNSGFYGTLKGVL